MVQWNGAETNFIQLKDGGIVLQMLFLMDGNISDKERAEYVNKLQNMVFTGKPYADIYREIAGNNLKEQHYWQ